MTPINNRGRPPRLFTHDGKTLTIRQWAAITGIGRRALFARIKRGWSIKRALTAPFNHQPSAPRYRYGGNRLTLREWAAVTGISSGTLHNRMKRGWSFDKAVNTPVGKRRHDASA